MSRYRVSLSLHQKLSNLGIYESIKTYKDGNNCENDSSLRWLRYRDNWLEMIPLVKIVYMKLVYFVVEGKTKDKLPAMGEF